MIENSPAVDFASHGKIVWLIGCNGMLGTELSRLFEKEGIPFTGTDREIDITGPAALAAFAEGEAAAGRPIDWIVNCAAYTAVDKAEDDGETCRRLNTGGAANIARTAGNIGARLIHFSTDYVFDGRGLRDASSGALRPYREDDPAGPIGVYGLTKRDGENAALENNPRSYIIRTAWLYGQYGNNFVATMLRLMNERDEIKVVNDQRGSPTWARDLAALTAEIIRSVLWNRPPAYGIYHYTNEGSITWFDFAREIYDAGRGLGLVTRDCAIRPCASAEYPAKVTRPAYSVLDKTKIKAALGITVPPWDVSLRRYLGDLAEAQGRKEEPRADVRWKHRFDNYRRALSRLSRIVEMCRSPGFADLEQTVCVKFFEMTHELAWKVMKDYLVEKGIDGIIGSKDAVRHAFNNGLIDDGEIWMQMIDARNEAVHTYDEEKAKALCEKIITVYHDRLRCFAVKMETLL
jgi:dTDP-4-dehydrorhamnose reductase